MGFTLGILSNLIGGSTYLIQKLALGGWPPAILILVRILVALPLLFAAAPRGGLARATRGDWIRMAAIGVFGLALPHLLGAYGLRETESLNGAILIGMEPITIVILSAVLLGERLTTLRIAGIVSAVAGAVLVISGGDFARIARFDPAARGNLLLALHGMLWGIYTIAAKPTLERVPPMTLTAVTSVIGLALIVPAAALEAPELDLSRALEPLTLACAVGLGIGVSFGAASLWNLSLKRITATQMAALIFLQPTAGMLFGVLGGESLGPAALGGSALVLAGVWLTKDPIQAPALAAD